MHGRSRIPLVKRQQREVAVWQPTLGVERAHHAGYGGERVFQDEPLDIGIPLFRGLGGVCRFLELGKQADSCCAPKGVAVKDEAGRGEAVEGVVQDMQVVCEEPTLSGFAVGRLPV